MRSIKSRFGSKAKMLSQGLRSCSKGNSLPKRRRIHRLKYCQGHRLGAGDWKDIHEKYLRQDLDISEVVRKLLVDLGEGYIVDVLALCHDGVLTRIRGFRTG